MPRTKIPKNSKRNREAANREEKIRIYEVKMDSIQLSLDDIELRYKTMTDQAINVIESRLKSEMRNMKMRDFLDILTSLERFEDFKGSDQSQYIASQSMCSNTTTNGGNSHSHCGVRVTNSRNDEGYLTEDSSSIGGIVNSNNSGSTLSAYNSSVLRSAKAMRTPGPLHSARARRERRSRSACGSRSAHPPPVIASSTSNSSNSASNAHRNSRSKMRTPMRPKALSADRTSHKKHPTSPGTPPMCFLRWPKPGEVALSKFGSPMVAQVMQDKFANVNIPIRNGVLSLRPKRLAEVEPDLLENLDPDTLNQIRTLNENLKLIVETANKAGLK